MSKPRRNRVNRPNRNPLRRCCVRQRVEQLEDRILPGGFLDLLAGAAIASTCDLLPEEPGLLQEPMLSREIEAEAVVSRRGDRAADLVLPSPLADAGADAASLRAGPRPNDDGDARPQPDDDLDFSRPFPSGATTNPLLAVALVDSFFAGTAFVESPSATITPHPQFTPATIAGLGSPVSQLGADAGVGSGSGQAFSAPGAGSPASSASSSAAGVPAIPAAMLGEGEGIDLPVDVDAIFASIAAGDGGETVVSGTGQIVERGPDGQYETTNFACINLPTRAAPDVFYREAGSLINIDNSNYQPAVHRLNDAADEGVVIGSPGTDETQDFPLPTGLPFVDDSFTPWLEVTSYKHWEEYHLVMARANGNPRLPLSHTQSVTLSKSYSTSHAYSQSVEVSRDVSAAAEIEVATIESRLGGGLSLSHQFVSGNSQETTFQRNDTLNALPCQTVGLYQKFEMVEVTMKYVHYHDEFGIGWMRTPNSFYTLTGQTATVTITSHMAKPILATRSARGNIIFQTVITP